jgi:hypothetical protein
MKVSDEKFTEIVKSSFSIRQVISTLGYIPAGGNYQTMNIRIKKLNLDTSHFHGQSWNKGKKLPNKVDTQDYLTNKKSIQSFKLRNRLIKDKILEVKCYRCNLTEWNEEPISLELHHKDGNTSNNNLSNLELLCPNCHSQTENHRRRKSSLKAE